MSLNIGIPVAGSEYDSSAVICKTRTSHHHTQGLAPEVEQLLAIHSDMVDSGYKSATRCGAELGHIEAHHSIDDVNLSARLLSYPLATFTILSRAMW
jgi:hypothetical protein